MAEASSDAYVAALLALYRRAAAQLRAQLTVAVRPGATAQQRRQALATVNAVIARLRRQAPGLTAAGIGRAYTVGLTIAHHGESATGRLGGIHQHAAEQIAAELAGRLHRANLTVGRQAQDAIRQAGLVGVGSTRAAGGARREAEQEVAALLRQQGMTGLVDRAGRRWQLDVYAHMAARTIAREAVTAATVNRLDELGIDLVQISSHPHARDICSPYDGNVYSLSGRDDRYPQLPPEGYPPIHVQCKHLLFPARQAFADTSRLIHGASSIEEVERALGLTHA